MTYPDRMTAREWGGLLKACACAVAPTFVGAVILLRVIFP